ncbi:unknown [Clostridium sp. CAG:354]|jgi:hypothetical protein|nr:hypothetical protein [Clostridium sp.]CDE11066.1 unknown [Clostridium sp. CAG:354]
MANKIKIEKDNVILSIEEEELAQYEARGYNKVGASKKIDSKNLQKEIDKLAKANEELKKKVAETEKQNEELAKANEELTKKVTELEKKAK